MSQKEQTNEEKLNQSELDNSADVNLAEENVDEASTAVEESEKTQEELIDELQKKIAAQHDAYLRLMADFENYRKNTLKDKNNLLKYGAEETLKKLLPVIDDFERALDSLNSASDMAAVTEGVTLIYNKFQSFLEQCNLKAIPASQGDAFDEDIHDAMTMFPAPTPELQGKIVDCVTKGYKLDDKVIRYAKVVVGQ